jgi:fibronectin type 3 domain-containing protein
MFKHHHHHHGQGHSHESLFSKAVHAVTDCVCEGLSMIEGYPPVKGCTCDYEDLEARTMMSVAPLATPAVTVVEEGPTIVELNWTESNPTATGYTVLRGTNGKTFAPIATVKGATNTSYTDKKVVANKDYFYEVQAVGVKNAKSTPSPVKSTVTPPVAPTSATSTLVGSAVKVTWTANDSHATGYVIYRTSGSTTKTLATVTGESTTSFTDTTALSGQAYTYQVAATNGSVLSAKSAVMATTTPLTAPSGLAATSVAATTSPAAVKLTWAVNDPNATGYYVLRSGDGTNFASVATVKGATVNTYTDTGANSLTTYYYKVVGYTAATMSTASNVVSLTTPLRTPTTLKPTTGTSGSVTFTWTDSDPNASGYYLMRSAGTGGGTFTKVATSTAGTTTTLTDGTVSSDTTYTYEVESFHGDNTSATSTPVTVVTPLTTPTGVTVSAASHNSVVIAWTGADTSAAGYYILRADGSTVTKVATVTGESAGTYTDNTAVGGHNYVYGVQAFAGSNVSAVTTGIAVTTPLSAPTSLAVTSLTGTSSKLTWTNNDTAAAGYHVLRSTDGTNFAIVGSTSGASTATFTDAGEATLTKFYFKVVAFTTAVTSDASNVASLTTPLTTPTAVTAVVKGPGTVQVTWTDTDTHATGFNVLRATAGGSYAQVGTTTTAKTFTDSTASSDTAYTYEVESYNGNTTSAASTPVSVTTQVAPPSGLTAAAASRTSVTLSWTGNDSTATGYYVLRTDGTTYTKIATVTGDSTTTYTDATAAAGHHYSYEVQAFNGANVSGASNVAAVSTPLNAPSALAVTASTGGSVQLTWTDNDTVATGYNVLRSTDGANFTLVSKVTGATAHTFSDNTVSADESYYYEVDAYDAAVTSAMSAAATVTTPMAAPASLTATAVGGNVNLAWVDKDSSATGYTINRSTDGIAFSQLATLTSPSANVYVDATGTAGTKYYYQVIATNSDASSGASNTASATIPQATTGTVAITTRYGAELTITATGTADSVTVTESGSNLSITADGTTYTDAVPADGLFVYTRGGSDAVTIDSSVTVNTEVETIDGAVDDITSAGTHVTAWVDSNDLYSGTGSVHRVSTFAGNVAKTTGASLANPTDSGATTKVVEPLFGSGPVAGDINQGGVGDCYFCSSLAAFATSNPSVITNAVVDMGDGTYTVQFTGSNGSPVFVRVNNSFSTGYYGPGFQNLYYGANKSIWGMVMEKAYAYDREGKNTYASLDSGWMGDVYNALGVANDGVMMSSYNATQLYNLLSSELTNGLAVTLGTNNPQTLVAGHAYTLVSATMNSQGQAVYVVRNPWGVSGDSLENSQGYATLTFAQMQSNFYDFCYATAA